ncbi:hypothetical protein FEP07_02602 [Burkholderia multivorans]|nr:hypothetical protein [Burkholderia multivorans]MDR9268638.1 hypothetical protein [Burkholderia multivorans]MDR9288492.1 hypothetical protein [Burkholderia multivorans]MDR9291230.1 hypothetical protein [Burkholderia multivorans]MDR9313829.1 hypothetical protein [Burkholderia multivorans]
MDVEPLAVVVLPLLPPIAIAWLPVAATPPPVPPAEYCACATLPTAAPATSATVATAFTTADLFGLPRAESISDAATQAPRASFQIERYVRFMSCYLQISTQHTWLFSIVEYAVRSRQSQK